MHKSTAHRLAPVTHCARTDGAVTTTDARRWVDAGESGALGSWAAVHPLAPELVRRRALRLVGDVSQELIGRWALEGAERTRVVEAVVWVTGSVTSESLGALGSALAELASHESRRAGAGATDIGAPQVDARRALYLATRALSLADSCAACCPEVLALLRRGADAAREGGV